MSVPPPYPVSSLPRGPWGLRGRRIVLEHYNRYCTLTNNFCSYFFFTIFFCSLEFPWRKKICEIQIVHDKINLLFSTLFYNYNDQILDQQSDSVTDFQEDDCLEREKEKFRDRLYSNGAVKVKNKPLMFCFLSIFLVIALFLFFICFLSLSFCRRESIFFWLF